MGPPCRAPRTSVAFDAMGDVRPCYRSVYSYGRIGTASLREIWDGAARADLVAAIDQADFSLGCAHCEWQTKMGTQHLAFARRYDDMSLHRAGDWPLQVEFALSNTCNLQCGQCSGLHSSAIRSQRERLPPLVSPYDDRFFDELAPFLDHLEVARFTGGEPFLSRSTQRVWDLMRASPNRPICTVVTNATQWNDRVERTLEDLSFQVTVSLDAIDPETLVLARVGIDPERVFANIERFRLAALRNNTWLGLSYCMMTTTWQEFGSIVRYADEMGMVVDCSVVTDPHELSLHRLPKADLAKVVAQLDREDERIRSSLGRNRDVWDGELARLRATLDQPDDVDFLGDVQVEVQRFRGDHPDLAARLPPVSLATLFDQPDGGDESMSPRRRGTHEQAVDIEVLRVWLGASTAAIIAGTLVDDVIVACSAGPGGAWLELAGLVGALAWVSGERIVKLLGPGGEARTLFRSSTRLDAVTRHVLAGVVVDVRSIVVRTSADDSATVVVETLIACRPVDPGPAPTG